MNRRAAHDAPRETGSRLRSGRRAVLRTAALVAAAYAFPGRRAEASGWEIVKVEGRDYVTARSIHSFYRFQSWHASGKSVVFRSPKLEMRAKAGSQELFINGVKFILSFPAAAAAGTVAISRMDLVKLVDPILRPSYIRVREPFRTVVIDAGHGGHDSGARCVYGFEKDLALDTAKRLRIRLAARGYTVQLTRDKDVFLSLAERVRIANRIDNSIFVSLHYNSAPNTAARGIETFVLPPAGTSSTYQDSRSGDGLNYRGNRRDSENIALATAVHASVLHSLNKISGWTPVDRGVKRARFAVLRGIDRPAVLVEGGFLSNKSEARMVIKSTYRDTLADSIAKAIANYRTALTR